MKSEKERKDKRLKTLSRNPYMNFLKDFRKKARKDEKSIDIVKRAAQEWRTMKPKDKIDYIREAFNAPLSIRKKYKHKNKQKRSADENEDSDD